MSNERLRRIKSVGLLGLSICSLGVLVDCPGNSPPRLMCGDFSMFVQPGTCELFTNPCDEDHQWLSPEASLPDGFELFGRPASVYVRRDVSGGVTTRSICAASGSGNIANQSVAFKYGRDTFDRGYLYGTGHMTLTVANVLHAALSATPARINAGESSQLVAIVSGGIPPYSYFWTPTSGLSATYIPILLASPTVTTTYQLMVVDSAGQPLGARPGENPSTSVPAEVTVFVNFEVQAFANPRVIRGGDVSQLNVVGKGGLPPYTYAWTPTSALDDPTIGSPLTGPETTTTYSVTVTDATGATRQASATVWVSDMGLGADAQPREIVVGESSQLNATVSGGTPPYSFSWAPAAGLSDSTIANPVASPAVTTTYTVTATDALGVSPQASATVTVYGLRVIPSASPTTVNPGQPAQLSVSVEDGTPPFSFDWHQLAAPSFNWERLPSADHALPDPTVSPSLTTQYRADVTDSRGLFGRGVVIVRVPLLVNPSATPSSINPGDSTQLAANVSGGGPFLTGYGCTWSPAAGLTSVSLCEQLASPAATTVYTVTARDLFGAMATGQVTVTVNTVDPPPTAAFIFTRDVSTFTIHLDGSGSTGNIVSYGWDLSWTAASPDAVTASPMTTFPFVEGTRGTITLTVTAADGRTASVTRRFP